MVSNYISTNLEETIETILGLNTGLRATNTVAALGTLVVVRWLMSFD